ncbi:hypothetical protein EFM1_23160 [Enterococcus faecium]|nr:hypothetical protein EFM1_23160 [Enterococcus faecium]
MNINALNIRTCIACEVKPKIKNKNKTKKTLVVNNLMTYNKAESKTVEIINKKI